MDKDNGHLILSPKNVWRTSIRRQSAEFKIIEDIPSTLMRIAASRKFSLASIFLGYSEIYAFVLIAARLQAVAD
jgi:hypothetical protein